MIKVFDPQVDKMDYRVSGVHFQLIRTTKGEDRLMLTFADSGLGDDGPNMPEMINRAIDLTAESIVVLIRNMSFAGFLDETVALRKFISSIETNMFERAFQEELSNLGLAPKGKSSKNNTNGQ